MLVPYRCRLTTHSQRRLRGAASSAVAGAGVLSACCFCLAGTPSSPPCWNITEMNFCLTAIKAPGVVGGLGGGDGADTIKAEHPFTAPQLAPGPDRIEEQRYRPNDPLGVSAGGADVVDAHR